MPLIPVVAMEIAPPLVFKHSVVSFSYSVAIK